MLFPRSKNWFHDKTPSTPGATCWKKKRERERDIIKDRIMNYYYQVTKQTSFLLLPLFIENTKWQWGKKKKLIKEREWKRKRKGKKQE